MVMTAWHDTPSDAWAAVPDVGVDVIRCDYAEHAKLVPVDPADERSWLVELIYSENRDQYRYRVTRQS
jgi:hypothetical protein